MKKISFIIITLGVLFTSIAVAADMKMKKIDGVQARAAHSDIYAENCLTCHEGKDGKVVNDAACVNCHGNVADIELDDKKFVLPIANPHKSVHYRNAVSCLACHSEHNTKAAVCATCHRSWFKPM